MHCLKINEDEEIDENESLKDYGADHKPLFSFRHSMFFISKFGETGVISKMEPPSLTLDGWKVRSCSCVVGVPEANTTSRPKKYIES